jgi:magnesium chelatase family protein
MSTRVLRESCPLDAAAELALIDMVERRRSMSARSVGRIIKVARTLADLDGHDRIDADDIREASRYRALDPLADLAIGGPADAPSRPRAEPFVP